METVMIACAECGKYGHLSCYGYPSEASVPEVVVCYYCCGELDEDEAPECSIDPGLSENEAQVSPTIGFIPKFAQQNTHRNFRH